MMNFKAFTDKLYQTSDAEFEELLEFIKTADSTAAEYLFEKARELSLKTFSNKVFMRGLIEISSCCKNDCLYCGLRRSNKNCERYRLTPEEILKSCREGYALGFRTFVLQGGEDPFFTDDKIVSIVSMIRGEFPDCAITLSIGERSEQAYRRFFDAGANRFLLRHETADAEHYAKLHPDDMSFDNRMECIKTLKAIGYQTGTGFMVGSPYQTDENLAKDLIFIKKLKPQMIGIGPFLSHHDTPFAEFENGTAEKTLLMVALLRLMNPKALIPATTALGTVADDGRERGVLAGANVVMPNLTPIPVRKKYLLYDNKICTGDEAAENVASLKKRMAAIGYVLTGERGDAPEI